MLSFLALSDQLENFFMDVHTSVEFSDLKGINNLARKMVETKKNIENIKYTPLLALLYFNHFRYYERAFLSYLIVILNLILLLKLFYLLIYSPRICCQIKKNTFALYFSRLYIEIQAQLVFGTSIKILNEHLFNYCET